MEGIESLYSSQKVMDTLESLIKFNLVGMCENNDFIKIPVQSGASYVLLTVKWNINPQVEIDFRHFRFDCEARILGDPNLDEMNDITEEVISRKSADKTLVLERRKWFIFLVEPFNGSHSIKLNLIGNRYKRVRGPGISDWGVKRNLFPTREVVIQVRCRNINSGSESKFIQKSIGKIQVPRIRKEDVNIQMDKESNISEELDINCEKERSQRRELLVFMRNLELIQQNPSSFWEMIKKNEGNWNPLVQSFEENTRYWLAVLKRCHSENLTMEHAEGWLFNIYPCLCTYFNWFKTPLNENGSTLSELEYFSNQLADNIIQQNKLNEKNFEILEFEEKVKLLYGKSSSSPFF